MASTRSSAVRSFCPWARCPAAGPGSPVARVGARTRRSAPRGARQDRRRARSAESAPCARRRGFDPVVLLLRRAHGADSADRARRRSCRAPRGALRRVRAPTRATGLPGPAAGHRAHGQKERTALERVEATVGTLRAAHVTGREVVVVDDVVT
ncbi:hypothetical protein NS263_14925, partial [Curtobacterium oceanosedimentum]